MTFPWFLVTIRLYSIFVMNERHPTLYALYVSAKRERCLRRWPRQKHQARRRLLPDIYSPALQTAPM